MDLKMIENTPEVYNDLLNASKAMGFTMASDLYVGSLLKSLVASKPKGNFLELGTGVGLSLSWMIEGMDEHSVVTSIDNDRELIGIAEDYFGNDPRVDLICMDGGRWIESYQGEKFDLIFADAWPGKYTHLEEVLGLLNTGGIYIIDDMLEQPNWPNGHSSKATTLVNELEKRKDLNLTKMEWSTGIVIAVKN